jgi:hypothetical protein
VRILAFILSVLIVALVGAGQARALDKVDPYICPTKTDSSGLECFLEAVPQTYTMCRQIKSIEIIEFGLTGAQEGVHGAKTEYCIDKHRLLITRPYQAALREISHYKDQVQGLRQLYDMWLESLSKLIPLAGETDAVYKERVSLPYTAFSEQIEKIRALIAADSRPAPKVASTKQKKKKKSSE